MQLKITARKNISEFFIIKDSHGYLEKTMRRSRALAMRSVSMDLANWNNLKKHGYKCVKVSLNEAANRG